MNSQSTELEIIMREALINNNIFFDEQVYTKRESKVPQSNSSYTTPQQENTISSVKKENAKIAKNSLKKGYHLMNLNIWYDIKTLPKQLKKLLWLLKFPIKRTLAIYYEEQW
ncbi:hypothetical protein [Salinibacillus xinjiangensis]|uniref:Uncharacterized protein n=1 Tax=Salinibacillus xinjiangensis TaxID=1229268 RepID=A0A6G1X767_9BACI|nr:hypothetical protein [Salinibacillus xinjiangensis]MRG86720.1 hypothetical protein [Salinibacillus xinjiangensis]